MSFSDLGAILVMQGFTGLSVFSVLLLMALGLAIIFGQMGVINMAHGEFLTLGAYMTYLMSRLTTLYAPSMQPYYFFFALVLAFVVAYAVGYVVERVMISKLYKRPLDTLLATWGLSLAMQQAFRSIFGPKDVSAVLPAWLLGAFKPTANIDIPINGVVTMCVAALMTGGIFLLLYRSRWGLQVRATMQNRLMSGAVGIDTRKVDRTTFALGCGVAGVAGAMFTTIGSTNPTAGTLYIVDTFLVVVFGGAQSLLGTIASAFSIAETQSTIEFFLTGSMAKVLTLSSVIVILMMRPQGLFSARVRK